MQEIIKDILLLLIAIPTGIFGAYLSKTEEEIFNQKQYFPTMIICLTILAFIFYFIDTKIALVLTFILITIISWKISTKELF
jgi:hypothetical protein